MFSGQTDQAFNHVHPHIPNTHIFLSGGNTRSQAVARRSKRVQKGTELTIAGTAATSAGTSLLCFLLRRTVQITCGHDQLTTRHQRHLPCPPPSSLPTLCSDCAFILKMSDLQSNKSKSKSKTASEVLTIVPPFN